MISVAGLLLLTSFCFFSHSFPRGNSKYHYYGIRVKPDSPLNRLQEDTQYMAMRQQPVHQKPRSASFFSPIHSIFFSIRRLKWLMCERNIFAVPVSRFCPKHDFCTVCIGSNLYRRWMVCLTACVAALSIVTAPRSSLWLHRANTISSTSV